MSSALERILARSLDVTDDLAAGADVILRESNALAPKESGDLTATGSVKKDRGGANTVAVEYTSVYARYQHEHMFFKHPTGGQPKFLETAMLTKGEEAINVAGQHLWGRL